MSGEHLPTEIADRRQTSSRAVMEVMTRHSGERSFHDQATTSGESIIRPPRCLVRAVTTSRVTD
jgi:hypothetical protein